MAAATVETIPIVIQEERTVTLQNASQMPRQSQVINTLAIAAE